MTLTRRLTGLFQVLGIALVLSALVSIPLANAQGLPDFTELVEKNAPAIVNVSVTSNVRQGGADSQRMEDLLRYFYGDRLPIPEPEQRQRRGMGSGFIIESNGYIVTNHHVVNGADEITVTLNDRREFPAELIGSDESSDLALLKIEVSGLDTVQLGQPEDLKVGEWVLAIGSPFGLSYSVSAGIVSYIGRNLPVTQGIGNYVSYIQTDVAINPGNSGGPLFNLDGEVIGINSQIFTNSGGSIGLSFAIPVEVAGNVIAQLKDQGHVSRGWLGIGLNEVSQELAEAFNLDTPRGALVSQVIPDSPAEAAGFRSGDVIMEFNGHDISTSGDLPYYVGLTTPGSEAEVDLIRNGDPMTLNLTVGDLDSGNPQLSSANGGDKAGNRLGLAVEELDAARASELQGSSGVQVTAVESDAAREAGIRPGDVVISINNQPTGSVAEFNAVLEQLPGGKLVPILIAREGNQAFFTLRVPE